MVSPLLPCAIGIVLPKDIDNQVLWILRRDLKIWVLPGGGIEKNETPEQAALREIQEETGLSEIAILRKTAVYIPINRYTSCVHVFLCRAEKGNLQMTEEAIMSQFFPIDAPPTPHFPFHAGWIREALANNQLIERPLHEFTWKKIAYFFFAHPVIVVKYLLGRFI